MDTRLLEELGLTPRQGAAYAALVEHGAAGAPQIAERINETRSNTYKILDKLCELGLATKDTAQRKIRYYPASPAALEHFVQKQSEAALVRERKLAAAMPDLLNFFFKHSEQPVVRYFQGEEGLQQAYISMAHSSTPIYFIASPAIRRFFGYEKAHRLRNLFPAHGVTRYGITQDTDMTAELQAAPRMTVAETDKIMKLHRTWISPEDYDSPVEWAVYEDKLIITSFGEEAMGMTIQSQQIADAFRRLFKLLDTSIRARPGYASLPKNMRYERMPTSAALRKKLRR